MSRVESEDTASSPADSDRVPQPDRPSAGHPGTTAPEAAHSPTPPTPTHLFSAYWQVLEGFHRRAALAASLTVLSGLLESAGILAIVPLLDAKESLSLFGVSLHGSSVRYASIGAFGVMAILSAVTRLVSERAYIRLTGRFEESCRSRLTGLALDMDWSAYLRVRIGELNTSLLLTIHQMAAGAQYLLRGIGLMGVAIVFAATAGFLSWQLSLLSLGFTLLAVVTYVVGVRPTERHTAKLVDSAAQLGHETETLFNNLKLFRSQGRRQASKRRMGEIFGSYADSYIQSQQVVPTTRFFFESTAAIAVVLLVVVALLTSGTATLSARSVAFLVLFFRLAPRLTSTQENLQQARNYSRWCQPWARLLKAVSAAQQTDSGHVQPVFERELRADSVTFRYPGTSTEVLQNVSWRLGPGEAIAFVGISGSGKTTILDLVTGLLRPSSGTVNLDGVDLREIDTEAWQEHIGLVLQDSPLFGGTVLENVWWTEPVRDRDFALECLDLANAIGFVDRLSDGPDTVLGERGASLSGGQRQRIALARALYRRPWLLMLDEPTSALDRRAESEVLRALADIKGHCSMIIVAHSLRPLALAERIYVLEHGSVVEEGRWEDLTAHPHGYLAGLAREAEPAAGLEPATSPPPAPEHLRDS